MASAWDAGSGSPGSSSASRFMLLKPGTRLLCRHISFSGRVVRIGKKNVPQVWPCVPPENAGQDQYPRTLFPIWTTSNQFVHFFPTVLLCKQLLCWFWLKTLRSSGTKSDTVSRISRSEFTSDTELTFNAILGSKNELEKLLKLEI